MALNRSVWHMKTNAGITNWRSIREKMMRSANTPCLSNTLTGLPSTSPWTHDTMSSANIIFHSGLVSMFSVGAYTVISSKKGLRVDNDPWCKLTPIGEYSASRSRAITCVLRVVRGHILNNINVSHCDFLFTISDSFVFYIMPFLGQACAHMRAGAFKCTWKCKRRIKCKCKCKCSASESNANAKAHQLNQMQMQIHLDQTQIHLDQMQMLFYNYFFAFS